MLTHLRVGPVVVLAALLATGVAWANLGRFKGQIIVSDQKLPVMDDPHKMAEALKKANKTTLEKPKDAAAWSFHLMAFPDRKPGTDMLSLLFFDTTGGQRNFLTSKDVSTDPSAEILVTEVEVSEEDGIKPGMKVDIALAKSVGDKQIELARIKVTFTSAK